MTGYKGSHIKSVMGTLDIAKACNAATLEQVIFASYGNDSIALIQWAAEGAEISPEETVIVHSDTGWAAESWAERVERASAWARTLGFRTTTIPSMGMRELVRMKKGWPRHGLQFCTEHLKIKPALDWLEENDPDAEAVCMVGIRRSESRARSQWPEWTEESERHGGRSLWSPLVRHTDEMRNALVERTPFDVLPFRSQECFPCVNSNRADLRQLTPERVEEIAALEAALGYTSKGKPRTMFRPYKHQGATGIREVWRWAKSERGKYRQLVMLGDGVGCDSGMCGEG